MELYRLDDPETVRTTALEPRLLFFVDATELWLRTQAEVELREPGRWGTTFTLLQSWGRVA